MPANECKFVICMIVCLYVNCVCIPERRYRPNRPPPLHSPYSTMHNWCRHRLAAPRRRALSICPAIGTPAWWPIWTHCCSHSTCTIAVMCARWQWTRVQRYHCPAAPPADYVIWHLWNAAEHSSLDARDSSSRVPVSMAHRTMRCCGHLSMLSYADCLVNAICKCNDYDVRNIDQTKCSVIWA